MLSNSQSEVKRVVEATTLAERIYHCKYPLFPGVEKGMYAEANKTLDSLGGTFPIDRKYLDMFFWDTMVVRGYFPPVPHSGKKKTSWLIQEDVKSDISKFFKGCGVLQKKVENMPRDKDGLVKFHLSVKTDAMAAEELFSLAHRLKIGDIYVNGYQLWLVDIDGTFNFAAHVKAGFMADASPLTLANGVVLEPKECEKAVGLQCPMWEGKGYQAKIYSKPHFMFICSGASNKNATGSQLHNIIGGGHPNIKRAFADKQIQEHGFARAEVRFSASVLPATLEEAKELVWAMAVEIAKTRVISQSLDKSVKRYLADRHQELLLIQKQTGVGYKVVVMRWMDRITGRSNFQSTSSVGLDKKLPETLEAALHLGYQWLNGRYPTVVVIADIYGNVEGSYKLKPTGRVADIQWDTRKNAERTLSTKASRFGSFEEVGMPSFGMEHPRKRIAVAVEDSSAWWESKREFELGAVESKKQREYKEREWAKVQNGQAKRLLERMVGRNGRAMASQLVGLDTAPQKAFMVIGVGVVANKYKDAAMLGADGKTYRMSKLMVERGWSKWSASPECPLVVKLGKAKKSPNGNNWYPDAVVHQWDRAAARMVDAGLEALFYTGDDYDRYADIKM